MPICEQVYRVDVEDRRQPAEAEGHDTGRERVAGRPLANARPVHLLAQSAGTRVLSLDAVGEALGVLEHLRGTHGVELELQHFDWGADKFLNEGVTLPEGALVRVLEQAPDGWRVRASGLPAGWVAPDRIVPLD